MRKMAFMSAVSLLGAALMGTTPTLANDSESEVALGGLVLKQSKDISMDSEYLFISAEQIRVSYRFTNTSTEDKTILVSFPLPDIGAVAPVDEDSVRFSSILIDDLAFETLVDGKRADLSTVQQAFFNGKDITSELPGLGLPISEDRKDRFSIAVNALDKDARETLLSRRLIAEAGRTRIALWEPRWTVRTTVTRQQLFPAGKTISVEHRYRPVTGGSVGGSLEPQYRSGEWGGKHIEQYCIDKGWLKSFDQRGFKLSGNKDGSFPHTETWIGYVLSSGANWRGPIKDFRLVVDKGKPGNMVSFCAEGVKKISPTQFEVRYKNFEPKKDLDILIINWKDS
jgi:hypothetical protein